MPPKLALPGSHCQWQSPERLDEAPVINPPQFVPGPLVLVWYSGTLEPARLMRPNGIRANNL